MSGCIAKNGDNIHEQVQDMDYEGFSKHLNKCEIPNCECEAGDYHLDDLKVCEGCYAKTRDEI